MVNVWEPAEAEEGAWVRERVEEEEAAEGVGLGPDEDDADFG